jgi:malic enzyme
VDKLTQLIYPYNIKELKQEYAQSLVLEVDILNKHNQQLPQKAKKYILTQENFLKMIQLTFSPEVAQAYQTQAQAYQTQAQA